MVSREHSQRELGYERLDEQHSPQLVYECGTNLRAIYSSSTVLTSSRLSKKQSGKLLATKPRSLPNGSLKNSLSKTAYNLRPGIARERTRRSS